MLYYSGVSIVRESMRRTRTGKGKICDFIGKDVWARHRGGYCDGHPSL